MSKITTSPPRRRGRQRSASAEAAILKAAGELLARLPLCEVTADAIAHRAGVSKATIYKWWPNKNLVALDALGASVKAQLAIPDTGSARQDFIDQLRATIALYSTQQGSLLRQFLAEGQNDAAFLKLFRDRFLKPRRDALLSIWRRGVDRGEIRANVDGELVLDLIFGPMMYRLLVGHGPLDDIQAAAIIDAVFSGLQTAPH